MSHLMSGRIVSLTRPGCRRFGIVGVLLSFLLNWNVSGQQLGSDSALGLSDFDPVVALAYQDVANPGVNRFSDALESLGLFRTRSLNRYTSSFSLFSLSLPGEPGPVVVLDGQPQYYSVYGGDQKHLIPVSPSDVDSVIIAASPGLTTDYYNLSGEIRVNTIRPEGVSIRGIWSFGNEVNDPGPGRFSDNPTPNVDRDGPRSDVRLSYGARPWFIQLAWRGDTHHATDARIDPRIWTRYRGLDRARITLSAPELFVSYLGPTSRHTIRAGGNRFKDFRYLDVLGAEAPIAETWQFVSAAGNFEVGNRFALTYRFDRREVSLRPRPVSVSFGNRWTERSTRGMIKIDRYGTTVSPWFSAGYASTDFRRLPQRIQRTFFRTAAGSIFNLGAGIRYSISGRFSIPLRTLSGRRSPGFAGQTRLSFASAASIVLSYTVRSNEEPDTLPQLLREGIPLPFHTEDRVSIRRLADQRRTIHLQLEGRLRGPLLWRPFIFIRRFQGVDIPLYLREFERSSRRFDALTTYVQGVDGTLFSAGSRILTKKSRHIRAELIYWYTHSISGSTLVLPGSDPIFEHAVAQNNGHQAQLSVSLRPNDRFTAYARLEWISSRNYTDYQVVSSSRRPDFLIADVSVEKDFWDDHISIALTGLNVGNVSLVRHPAGGADQMVFRVSIRGKL